MVTWNKWIMAGNEPDGTPLYYGEGDCLSADTKPTTGIFNGSKLLEMDTGVVMAFDKENVSWGAL